MSKSGTTRRAGQVIQRGERTFLVRLFVGRDKGGRRKYQSKTIHGTKKDAQAYLNKVLRDQDLGTYVQPSRMLVTEYLDRWLATAAKPRVRSRTYVSYADLLDRYIRPSLGNHQLSALTTIEIQDVYNKLQGQGLSPRTVRYVHSVFRSAMEQAVIWRMIPGNPVQHVDLPRQKREELRPLSREETRVFLRAAQGTRYGTLFEFLLASGLRPGEGLALKWTDVDFETGRVQVQRALVRDRLKHEDGTPNWRFEEPKTARARRTVPLPASTTQALRSHRHQQVGERLKMGPEYEDNGLVFAAENGRPIQHRNLVRQYFKPLLLASKLPSTIRLYDLRHTCATLLLASGVNPKVVSERLGHASVALTLDIYSHVLPNMQEGAAAELESMLYTK